MSYLNMCSQIILKARKFENIALLIVRFEAKNKNFHTENLREGKKLFRKESERK